MIHAFPIKTVSPEITIHPIEQRGFVTVPFDYRNPDGDTIQIFYRLIPAYGSTPSDSSKPIIVIFNGGPGIASSAYRPLDFDYAHPDDPKNGSFNRLKYLLKSYRVLMADQRGTDGQSAPLDMENPKINANGIAHYFSSDFQARDYLAVIENVIPKTETFLIIAQSYGGMVGMQYLSLANARKPQGMIFSCSALPYEDIFDAHLSRREEQRKLNLKLKKAVPNIEELLSILRNHLKSIGFEANYVNSLYTLLGKGVPGVWEPNLVKQIEKMQKQDHAETSKDIKDNLGGVNLLNYVLSSANFTPGHTDRTLARLTSDKIPFEPWMLDENWMLMQSGADAPWKEAFVSGMDQNPPPPTPFSTVAELRSAIALNQILFTAADDDAYVPKEAYLRALQKFEVEGHTQVQVLPGGHSAIFLEKGLDTIAEWSRTLK